MKSLRAGFDQAFAEYARGYGRVGTVAATCGDLRVEVRLRGILRYGDRLVLIVENIRWPTRAGRGVPRMDDPPLGADRATDVRHGLGILTAVREAAEALIYDGTVEEVSFATVINVTVSASLVRRGYVRDGMATYTIDRNKLDARNIRTDALVQVGPRAIGVA